MTPHSGSRLRIKRIYEEPTAADGLRILVDRLWPRGVSKENAQLDYWFKQIAPSPPLRKWFGHDPGKFTEFAAAYRQELDLMHAASEGQLTAILDQVRVEPVTLLYSAKDPVHNHAVILQEWLCQATASGKTQS